MLCGLVRVSAGDVSAGEDGADDAEGHVPRPRPQPSPRRDEVHQELGLPCTLRLQQQVDEGDPGAEHAVHATGAVPPIIYQ